MPAAAFFDLDNTVVRGSSLFPFAWEMLRRGRVTVPELAQFAWLNARFVATRTESVSGRDFVLAKALELVKDQRVADVLDLCRDIAPAIVRTRTNLAVTAEVRRHRDMGAQTWLVTASPLELAEEIAELLGMTGALGTRAESVEGVYTGRLVGDVLHGARKAEALTVLAAVEEIDLAHCWAYSDSLNDLPMLSLVGHATVVNANRRLDQVARRNGWRVMRASDRQAPRVHDPSPAVPSTRP